MPMVQILDIPVPQKGDQLVATLKHLDKPIPKQVIEVPKISSSSSRSRIRRSPRVLLEVPTVVSFSSLQQQTAEHPVPRRRREEVRGLGFSTLRFAVEVCPVLWMRLLKGFFALFFKFKKSAEVTRQSSARGHSSSSTLSSDQMALAGLSDEFWEDEAGGVCMRLPNARWYLLRSDPAVY